MRRGELGFVMAVPLFTGYPAPTAVMDPSMTTPSHRFHTNCTIEKFAYLRLQ
jgi:hypothetical protein